VKKAKESKESEEEKEVGWWEIRMPFKGLQSQKFQKRGVAQ
jgi:hypothetical protein